MAEVPDRHFYIIRNLRDAGCDEATIHRFLRFEAEGKTGEQLRLLSGQKASLLGTLHANQYKIDCLDHMVFCMTQKAKKDVNI